MIGGKVAACIPVSVLRLGQRSITARRRSSCDLAPGASQFHKQCIEAIERTQQILSAFRRQDDRVKDDPVTKLEQRLGAGVSARDDRAWVHQGSVVVLIYAKHDRAVGSRRASRPKSEAKDLQALAIQGPNTLSRASHAFQHEWRSYG